MNVLESARTAMFSPRRGAGAEAAVPAPEAVVELGGDSVAVRWGSRRDGAPTFLVVHGWEGSAAQFAPIAQRLCSAGHTVVGVDAPGHGHAPDAMFSSARHAEGLRRADDRFGPFAGVVAHSLGAVAAHLARLDGLATPALVLLAPVRSMSEQVADLGARLRIPRARHEEFLAMVVEGLGRPLGDLDLDTAPPPPCPVLVCHDHDDQMIAATSSRRLVRAWPGARLRESSGLRHRGLLLDDATIDAVVEHLLADRSV